MHRHERLNLVWESTRLKQFLRDALRSRQLAIALRTATHCGLPGQKSLRSSPKVYVVGAIQLADGIAQLLRREKVFAYRYKGTRYDCGSKLGFLQATVDLGELHDEVGTEFRGWLTGRG